MKKKPRHSLPGSTLFCVSISAAVFVQDLASLSRFYAFVTGQEPAEESISEGWVVFALGESRLWLRAMPLDLHEAVADTRLAPLREETPIKLVLPITTESDFDQHVEALGGRVIARPWGTDYADPEGNIFAIGDTKSD